MGIKKAIQNVKNSSAQAVRVTAKALGKIEKASGKAVGAGGRKGGAVVGTIVHRSARAIGDTSDYVSHQAGRVGSESGRAVAGFIGKPKRSH